MSWGWRRTLLVLLVVVLATAVAPQAAAVSADRFAWPASGHTPANDVAWHQANQSGSRAVDIQAPVGTEVGAAQSGVVTVAFAGCGATESWGCGRGFGNHVVVRHDRPGVGNPLYTLYGHLHPTLAVGAGTQVVAGQRLGTIAMSGSTEGPHVHFAISTCANTWWGSSCTIWNGPDTAGAAVVKGADMPGTYSQLAGSGSPPVTTPRIGLLNSGQLSVKEGGLGAGWQPVASGSSFAMSPNRIAIYDGQLRVKEGPLNAVWTTVTGAVDAYAITDTRIGILVDGQLHIKEGGVHAPWVHVASGTAFAMSPNRVAIYDGRLRVKEGQLNAGWTTVVDNVDDFQITDNRIGIRVGTKIHVKDGPVGAVWTHVGDGSDFAISRNRIAVYSNQLIVKEGPINAAWTTVVGTVDDFDITDNRIGIRVDGQLHIKDGPLNAPWNHVSNAGAFDLT